jgi:hypothetical protein
MEFFSIFHGLFYIIILLGLYILLYYIVRAFKKEYHILLLRLRKEHGVIVGRLDDLDILTKKINSIIEDRLLNNFRGELTDIMYELLQNLDNDNNLKSALWAYIRNKLNDVYQRYIDVKLNGLKQLNKEEFQKDLLGANGNELLMMTNGWNPKFIDEIETINKQTFENFKRALFDDLAVEGTTNWLILLKTHGKAFFRKNVTRILDEFGRYPEHFIKREIKHNIFTTATKKEDFIEYLKEEISTGIIGLENAISELKLYLQSNKEKLNDLITISASYEQLKRDDIRGIIDPASTEYNKIRNRLLNFINTI